MEPYRFTAIIYEDADKGDGCYTKNTVYDRSENAPHPKPIYIIYHISRKSSASGASI
ncbi:MAG: hypothetical protein K2K90_10600 [Lachnospiraceae bacterium]|nr:hypothetical protein [Lachnospiraceae bacterium]